MMPFENLAIAPSSGWPAIAPIIFLLALFSSPRSNVLLKRIFILLFLTLIFSSFGWLLSSVSVGLSRNFIPDVITSFASLLLGAAFYFVTSDYLFFSPGSQNRKFVYLLNGLIYGSFFALFLSVIILLSTYFFAGAVQNILVLISKRTYDVQRFSFLFAEPSFVSVHVYGVLTPLAWLAWKMGCRIQFVRLLWVIITYIVLSIWFLSSLRFIIDTIFVFILFLCFYFSGSFKNVQIFKIFSVAVVILVIFFNLLQFVQVDVLSFGRLTLSDDFMVFISSDASLASRYFRINAASSALLSNPYLLFTGAGLGNVGALVDSGYIAALGEFYSPYMDEVESIKELGSGSNIFNLHIRMIGEFGIVVYAAFALFIYRKNLAFIYILMGWVLIQFDSYAFYLLWIYFIAITVSKRCNQSLQEKLLQEKSF